MTDNKREEGVRGWMYTGIQTHRENIISVRGGNTTFAVETLKTCGTTGQNHANEMKVFRKTVASHFNQFE